MLQSETITHSLRNLYPLLVYRILTARPGELSEVFSAGEGLENKLRKGVLEAADWDGLGRAVKSKRYTETRVNRLLVHTLMDFRKKDMKEILEQELLYARVLGFTGEGASLLKKIKRQGRGRIPILTNINKELEGDDPLRALLHWDVLASHLYHLNQGRNLYENSDFLRKPVIL